MVGESVQTDLAPGFSVERGNIVERQPITLRLFATVDIQQQNGAAIAPRTGILARRRGVQFEIRIGRKLHCFGSQQASGLVMAMTSMDAAPTIDDYGWAKDADHFHHVLEYFISPDFFGFLG